MLLFALIEDSSWHYLTSVRSLCFVSGLKGGIPTRRRPGNSANHVGRNWRTRPPPDRNSIWCARRHPQPGLAEPKHEHLRTQSSTARISRPRRQLPRPRVGLVRPAEGRKENQGHGKGQISGRREPAVLALGAMDRDQARCTVRHYARTGIWQLQFPAAKSSKSVRVVSSFVHRRALRGYRFCLRRCGIQRGTFLRYSS